MPVRPFFRHVTLAVSLGLLFVAAGYGQASAATTVGQTFTPTASCISETDYQTGVASGTSFVLPFSGVITSWSFQAAATPPTLKLKVGRGTGLSSYTTIGESALVTPAPNALSSFPTRILAAANDVLGVFAATSGACAMQTGSLADTDSYISGDQAAGTTNIYLSSTSSRLGVSAQLERDADGDGFGDETQDACPTSAAIQGACQTSRPPDTTKPVLAGLSLSPKSFRAAKSGPSVAASAGSTVRYRVSEVAAVGFRVERALPGRRAKGRCVKPRGANRGAKRCTRYVTLRGSFGHQGAQGSNGFRFRGRLGGRSLAPGRYRLRGVARDPAGNRSSLTRTGFRIVR